MVWNLPGVPWLIAHKSMLQVNKPKMFTICGKDYVLWKNERGEVSALENICPHMGAKLSDGWICPNTNTIACPFHALEFDNEGRAILPNDKISKPLAKPLELFFQGDFIWTYANETPKLPIPDVLEKLSSQYRYIGSTKEVTIKAPFLDVLEINHDLNHAKGTHREVFRINSTKVDDFQDNGYYSISKIRHFRAENTLKEYLKNPSLLFTPKVLGLVLENYFPSLVVVYTDTPVGKAIQVFIIYPETETTTRTFIPIFAEKSFGILNPLLEKSTIKSTEEIIHQDGGMLETLYPRFEPKIRLENEEPVHWVRKHYYSWNDLTPLPCKGRGENSELLII
ncbi:MAG: Rieske 2Fe-2S domain-containing protein [Scytonematopsis contorta HA4267-MV1]|jgi:phenylpropionate dioxygenase-like ring-hydroxylating dioxygenase large terminal subunit|nr:Rieske 2Fe-2S domain-containing protein [Scytonematopsis contorta HA4267-MV1]